MSKCLFINVNVSRKDNLDDNKSHNGGTFFVVFKIQIDFTII